MFLYTFAGILPSKILAGCLSPSLYVSLLLCGPLARTSTDVARADSSYYCCTHDAVLHPSLTDAASVGQILVHRDFLSPARAKLHSFPSLAICSNAARSCSHVLDHLRKQGQLASAFWYAPLCAITAGLVLRKPSLFLPGL